MNRSLEEIQRDISRARDWGKKHFNAYVDEETTPSHLLAQQTCMVEFPEPDRMTVSPMTYGRPSNVAIAEYILCWIDGRLFWEGGFLLRPDIVVKLEVRSCS